MLSRTALADMAHAYLNGADPRNPLASPVFGDFSGVSAVANSCRSRRGTARRRQRPCGRSVPDRDRRHTAGLGADDPHVPLVSHAPAGGQSSDRGGREMDRRRAGTPASHSNHRTHPGDRTSQLTDTLRAYRSWLAAPSERTLEPIQTWL